MKSTHTAYFKRQQSQTVRKNYQSFGLFDIYSSVEKAKIEEKKFLETPKIVKFVKEDRKLAKNCCFFINRQKIVKIVKITILTKLGGSNHNHIENIERVQRRFTRMLYRKFHYPYEIYKVRIVRLQMTSLENRRLGSDEMHLYKLKNRIFSTNIDLNFENTPGYNLRRVNLFRLPTVHTNVESFSPILRMHRQHMHFFNSLDLREPCFKAFKRYALHEINDIQNSVIPNYR